MIAVAAILAFVVGFALQRGRICAVLAVREGVIEGRWSRFLSLLECASWAMIGLLLADALGAKPLSAWTWSSSLPLAMIGGALFGIGALINGSCAFGSATRLASGELAIIAVIAGFLVGFSSAQHLGWTAPSSVAAPHLSVHLMSAIAVALSAFALWRGFAVVRVLAERASIAAIFIQPRWPPALAMFIVGAANVALVLVAANWSYLSVLGDALTGSGALTAVRWLIVALFFAGAVSGALTAGRFRWRGASVSEIVTRIGAGVVMGLGAALIPGGNDALIVFGMPLLQPAAFAAYGTMVGVIAVAFLVGERFRSAQGA
ncbi:MAG: YeeE/YedE thiosulfate transporter family protein [Hyphomonadaceae bacterium]|nr:YeeE/YedE thiosulfate transporter family protein [Hyphomonadaceae bacterium]